MNKIDKENQLDELDNQLLKLLYIDALQSSNELAKQLHTSSATIRRRINRLKQNKQLKFIAVTEPLKRNNLITAVILLEVSHDKLSDASQMLIKKDEIIWLTTATGQFNIIALVQFPHMEWLHQFFLNVLGVIEGLRSSKVYLCLHEEKSLKIIP